MLRYLRPRRHEPDHRHRHRVHGFLLGGLYLLQRAPEPHRPGRVSGGGHYRHYDAHYEIHLSGAGCDKAGGHGAGGLRPGPQRPPRSGGHRHHPGRDQRRVRLRAAASGAARRLRASGFSDPPGLHQQPENAGGGSGRRGKAGGDDRGIQKAHADLRRRSGPQPCPRGIPAVCPPDRRAGGHHRDGWAAAFPAGT